MTSMTEWPGKGTYCGTRGGGGGSGVALALIIVLAPACKKDPCIDKSKPALDQCTARSEALQHEVNAIKRQLAQALANPGTIQVDPSVLMIDGKPIRALIREGTLSQDEVVKTLKHEKGSLQACYNRALKRDSALHHRKIRVTLAMKVVPSGTPRSIRITPNYNAQMTDCMLKAIRRWSFPSFTGSAVGVESPMTFTPKK